MPDGLYERDILAWSEHQADLLRRLGRGERVNDVDWANVAEEIESVGLSELRAVQSYLRLILADLLKLHSQPNSDARNHWFGEIVGFQADANERFALSMRQRIELDRLYATALKQLLTSDPSLEVQAANPFGLDDLLTMEGPALLGRLLPAA